MISKIFKILSDLILKIKFFIIGVAPIIETNKIIKLLTDPKNISPRA